MDGDQTVLFARIWKKIEMVNIKTTPTEHQKHSNTRYTAEAFLPDPKYMTISDSGLSAHSHPRPSGATELQCTQTQSFDVPDRYVEQIHLRKEWEEKMERPNEKYGLDYFSDTELDSELDEGKNYRYEHKLI